MTVKQEKYSLRLSHMLEMFISRQGCYDCFGTNVTSTFHCTFDLHKYSDQLFDCFGLTFPNSIKTATIKRKAEFLAGRYAAQQALKSVGYPVQNIPIGRHRAPVWPNGIVGSITHTDNIAMCAIAASPRIRGVGLDRENIIDLAILNNINGRIVTEVEAEYFRNTNVDWQTAMTIAFSAKESFFKAAYPLVGYYFDFDSVSVVSICPDYREQSFTLMLMQDLGECLHRGLHIGGRFAVENNCVTTLVILE